MKIKIFPIIALAALSVSASAAFYSVYGLSHLFAGAKTEVIIMASSLEFAKLVIASALYQYWSIINKYIRIYLMVAMVVLITITSGGIYGFLSGAYQDTANRSVFIENEVSILETRKLRFESQMMDAKNDITTITTALANPTSIQYVDRESGQLVTTTSARQRKMLQNQLSDAKSMSANMLDSISVYDLKILDMQINSEVSSELGPLKYMAVLTGYDMDVIINWFMLLIIFVFDPLALVLVVVANMAFDRKELELESDFIKHISEDSNIGEDLIDELERIGDILTSGHLEQAGSSMKSLKKTFKDKFKK